MVHDKRHTKKKGSTLMPFLGSSFLRVYNPLLFTYNKTGKVKN